MLFYPSLAVDDNPRTLVSIQPRHLVLGRLTPAHSTGVVVDELDVRYIIYHTVDLY
jgi:hypothetical protein